MPAGGGHAEAGVHHLSGTPPLDYGREIIVTDASDYVTVGVLSQHVDDVVLHFRVLLKEAFSRGEMYNEELVANILVRRRARHPSRCCELHCAIGCCARLATQLCEGDSATP